MATPKAKKNHNGFFVTFEGGEGSGKTTVLKEVAATLRVKEPDLLATHEPGGTQLGATIRSLLLDQRSLSIARRTEFFLFLADRAQHVTEVILPALEKKALVLCDRFTDSTLAYQEHGNEAVEAASFATGGLIPDLTLLFDIDPTMGLARARKASAGHVDKIEARTLAFHSAVRKVFLARAQAEPDRFYLIDAAQPLEKVAEEALHVIQKRREVHT